MVGRRRHAQQHLRAADEHCCQQRDADSDRGGVDALLYVARADAQSVRRRRQSRRHVPQRWPGRRNDNGAAWPHRSSVLAARRRAHRQDRGQHHGNDRDRGVSGPQQPMVRCTRRCWRRQRHRRSEWQHHLRQHSDRAGFPRVRRVDHSLGAGQVRRRVVRQPRHVCSARRAVRQRAACGLDRERHVECERRHAQQCLGRHLRHRHHELRLLGDRHLLSRAAAQSIHGIRQSRRPRLQLPASDVGVGRTETLSRSLQRRLLRSRVRTHGPGTHQ